MKGTNITSKDLDKLVNLIQVTMDYICVEQRVLKACFKERLVDNEELAECYNARASDAKALLENLTIAGLYFKLNCDRMVNYEGETHYDLPINS